MTPDKRAKTVGSLAKSFSLYFLLKSMACSRIHWRAFSRFPAAIKLELDECSLTNVLELLVPAPLLLEWPLSFDAECECIDGVRPQRAGFNDAKNDDVFELEPNRERDDDEVDDPPLAALPTFIGLDDDVDGVFRPDDPIRCKIISLI